MVPLVKTALRQSSAQARKVRREELAQQVLNRGTQKDKDRRPPPETSKGGSDPAPPGEEIISRRQNVVKEFETVTTSAPRRLNDVAQEPPTIRKFPRGAVKNDAVPSGVLSMAQKVMMEEERDKVIRRYRELKARRLRDIGGVKLDE